jgi:hypothetical protein
MREDGDPMAAPETSETSFVRLADAYRRENLTEDAIRICREGLLKFPSSLRGRIVLGQSLLDGGAIGEAIVELVRVAREGRDDPDILALLCDVRLTAPQTWPVGADVLRESGGPGSAPLERPEATAPEPSEPPVLILDASDQPMVADAVPAVSDSALATPTLAGLYASQGDPGTAEAILRQIAPEEVPPTPEVVAPAAPRPSLYLKELARLRRVAEYLRKASGRSTETGA